MTLHKISLNPLAEYLEATEARRLKILEEQLVTVKTKVFHYQLAKARMKKSIELGGNFKPVNDGIKELTERAPTKPWKQHDRKNSIAVLEKFKKMLLPTLIKENKVEIIKPEQKHLNFNGLSIVISPNIVFRVTIDGVKYIGACKIHVSKDKAFSHKQSKLVANLLEQYLSNCVVGEDEIVHPILCFCLDPFAGTTINSNSRVVIDMKQVKQLCNEIIQSFDKIQINAKVA